MNRQCPICRSANLSACIEIDDVPIYCNVLHAAREDAVKAPKGDIDLVFCRDCAHLFNIAFDPKRIEYTHHYDNSLHYSPRFQAYATALANALVDRYDLNGKTIIEIACGKGDFLNEICILGNNRGYGFDPSYEPERRDETGAKNLTFVQDYYSEQYSDYKADLICCRHALEHIDVPSQFLSTLRDVIGDERTAVFFEVPNGMFTIKEMGIWDLIYEHCSYFCENSLATAFNLSGFEVSDVQSAFDDQFLCIDAKPINRSTQASAANWRKTTSMADDIHAFRQRYQEKVAYWQATLDSSKRDRKRIVAWGAGSKGATFLNVLKAQDSVGYIVDLNPHKQGKFIPGTGHEVVAPEFLVDYHPDAVIVMNPIYAQEVREIVNQLNVEATIISA